MELAVPFCNLLRNFVVYESATNLRCAILLLCCIAKQSASERQNLTMNFTKSTRVNCTRPEAER